MSCSNALKSNKVVSGIQHIPWFQSLIMVYKWHLGIRESGQEVTRALNMNIFGLTEDSGHPLFDLILWKYIGIGKFFQTFEQPNTISCVKFLAIWTIEHAAACTRDRALRKMFYNCHWLSWSRSFWRKEIWGFCFGRLSKNVSGTV